MAKTKEPEAPTAAEVTAVLDPAAFIAKVDRATLETQIGEAADAVRAAEGRHRALISLRRLIDYRDGKLLRKKGGSRCKDKNGEPPATPAEPAAAPEADDDDGLIDSIQMFLAKRLGPADLKAVAQGVGCPLMAAHQVLTGNPSLFRTTNNGGWKAVD